MNITVEKLAEELGITWEQVLYRAHRAGIIQSFTREQADIIRIKPRRGRIGTQTDEQRRKYNRDKQAERRANLKKQRTDNIPENKS